MIYGNFSQAIKDIGNSIKFYSNKVHTQRWQGTEIDKKPEMRMREVLDVYFKVPLETEDLTVYQHQIKPNLPWADNHFEERVCGMPINPGIEWANWPYGKSADTFRDSCGKFNHNYMQRYWPKLAGLTEAATETAADFIKVVDSMVRGAEYSNRKGIYHEYGDLGDVVDLLQREPDTRQAFFPVWFPEDTGVVHRGRVPCSIGYQFLMRNGHLHIAYYLRSCDYTRHFRDDIYLTVRLLLWVLQQLRERDPVTWNDVKPGFYTMHIMNLHVFENDYLVMRNEN